MSEIQPLITTEDLLYKLTKLLNKTKDPEFPEIKELLRANQANGDFRRRAKTLLNAFRTKLATTKKKK